MGRTISLVRAAALLPVFHWLEGARLPVEPALGRVGFDWYPWEDADRPVPLRLGLRFMAMVAEAEGIPDLGARSGSARGALAGLGALGRTATGGGTAGDALGRLAAFMPRWASGEDLIVTARPGALSLVHRLDVDDPAELHLGQQYSAAILAGIVAASPGRPEMVAMAIPPMPGLGVEHLRPHFGDAVTPSRDGRLRMTFAAGRDDPREDGRPEAASGDTIALAPLAGLSLPATVSLLIATMLGGAAHDGAPTVRQVADAAGLSVRTMQRALAEAGSSFSALLEAERRAVAMQALGAHGPTIGQIARTLGYERQSSLTRAVRRWSDVPPSEIRRRATGDAEVRE